MEAGGTMREMSHLIGQVQTEVNLIGPARILIGQHSFIETTAGTLGQTVTCCAECTEHFCLVYVWFIIVSIVSIYSMK